MSIFYSPIEWMETGCLDPPAVYEVAGKRGGEIDREVEDREKDREIVSEGDRRVYVLAIVLLVTGTQVAADHLRSPQVTPAICVRVYACLCLSPHVTLSHRRSSEVCLYVCMNVCVYVCVYGPCG